MTDDVKSGPLPGAAGGPDIPSRDIPGGGATDTGRPGAGGGGGVQPIPNPSGIPGKAAAGEGEDKGDLAPGPDQTLNDIKKGSR
ncbi:MAG: hypothetical protein WCF79_10435 [Rhodomicrobium sp.]